MSRLLVLVLSLVAFSSDALAQVQVYAKAGLTFGPNQPFVLTGNGGPTYWEIDLPTSGSLPHGITRATITATVRGAVMAVGQGPSYVYISENVTKGDELTPDGSRGYRRRSSQSDALAGYALKAGTGSLTTYGSTVALLTTRNDLFNQLWSPTGSIIYSDGVRWRVLAGGLDGARLESQGVAAPPRWSATFSSGLMRGTGGVQNIAHGLGRVPRRARCWIVGILSGISLLTNNEVVEGAHDASNLSITAPSGLRYKCEAE